MYTVQIYAGTKKSEWELKLDVDELLSGFCPKYPLGDMAPWTVGLILHVALVDEPLDVNQTMEEIRSGSINPAVLGPQMWAKWLHNPYRHGGPKSGEDSKWIHGLFHIRDRQQVHPL